VTLSIEAERNRALLGWYAEHGRDLPWRHTTDPYAILVSEVMLQQTQVDRVIPYYQRFLAKWPTVNALAAADFADVMRMWSGLGYNSRAKRLLDAARVVADTGWPSAPESLAELPGVGPYTAAAVASFAYGERVAAVDTNTKRVLSRWHGEMLQQASLQAAANADVTDDAAAWNQAIMDLGAMVCAPHRPRCDMCPVAEWCAGPDTYQAPRPQSRFAGSVRQVRGALVRKLVTGTFDIEDLSAATGFAAFSVEVALADLIEDGIVTEVEDGFSLAD